MGAIVRCLSSQKLNHHASSVCWCSVLLEHVKVQLSHNVIAVHVLLWLQL